MHMPGKLECSTCTNVCIMCARACVWWGLIQECFAGMACILQSVLRFMEYKDGLMLTVLFYFFRATSTR